MLRERHPGVGVVVLSTTPSRRIALALLESGLEGRAYMLKERVRDRAQLVSAIHTVAAGGSLMDPKVVEPLIRARSRGSASPLAELSARELEVLGQIAQGKSNAAIADSLVLTKRAVEKHINSIFMKLNLAFAEDVSKRVKAALLFLAEFDPPQELGPQPSMLVSRLPGGVARASSQIRETARRRSRCLGRTARMPQLHASAGRSSIASAETSTITASGNAAWMRRAASMPPMPGM